MPSSQRLIRRMVAAAMLLAPLAVPVAAWAGVERMNDFARTMASMDRSASLAQARIAATPGALPSPPASIQSSFTLQAINLSDLDMPSLPSIAVAELPAPSVETPLHKLFCVEYARARSGLAVFGDAKLWWDRARKLYARAASPVEDAVMVFSGSRRLKRGHVAVVASIVSAREIRVDQANWENHGEIDHATPVLDVSKKNDWSQVRVWDIRSQSFGAHVYAISGFIAKSLIQKASNE